jgi:hypothetical protein
MFQNAFAILAILFSYLRWNDKFCATMSKLSFDIVLAICEYKA